MTEDDSLSEEERALFRKAVGAVKKMRNTRVPFSPNQNGKPYADHLHSKSTTLPQFERKQQRESCSDHFSMYFSMAAEDEMISSEQSLLFVRDGIQCRQIKRLRNGQILPALTLDLHHFTSETARDALIDLLITAEKEKIRCFKIIHGKGRAQSGPRLKRKMNTWLKACPNVLAFCSALPHDGGTGALYCLLKRPKKQ